MCQALLLSFSAVSLSLVCEEDGTEVESDEFLMTLPDNTMLMALEPGHTWRSPTVSLEKPLHQGVSKVQSRGQLRPVDTFFTAYFLCHKIH